MRTLGKHALIAALPLIVFMAIRVLMGGAALEANYGFDMAQGELPPEYVARFTEPSLFVDALYRTLLGLGALWLGLSAPAGWYRRTLVCVPILLLATWLLSSRIMRVEGILALLLIPGVLRLISKEQ